MSCYGEKYDKCALRAPHTFPESCFAQKTEQLNQTPKVLLPEVKHSWQLAKHFCDVEYAPNEMEKMECQQNSTSRKINEYGISNNYQLCLRDAEVILVL